MSRYHAGIIAVGLIVLGIVPAVEAESPSVLLEKGIHLEETVGDLDKAIAVYEQIVDNAEANRPSVAQAYLRLGHCRLKKGDKAGAIEAFATVEARYGDQREAVAAARKELARLRPAGSGRPLVVRTTPEFYANDVDPDLKEVTVTFDQPMRDGSWSWTGGGETFPEVTGQIHYDAARTTCVLPVKLKPGNVYWIGINSPSHQNFKSAKGVPAQRRVILFATKGADGKPTAIPEEMLARAKAINDRMPSSAPRGPQPVVIRNTPDFYAEDVEPELKEVTVTFDQKMRDGSWSWTGGGDTFPEVTDKIHYDAARTTCVLPVKLKPGTVYWIGINSPSHQNFRSTEDVPAVRRVLLFATKGADGKPTPIPEEMLTRAREINEREPVQVPDCRSLLDAETRAGVTRYDNMFVSFFQPETEYEKASPTEREAMVKAWITEAKGGDFEKRTRAIAALGNVKAQSAVDVLIDIANEPMRNNRPRWLAVRALERIGDPKAVPTLIELVDHGNENTRLYARAALAAITGVYFGTDKEAWRTWWEENFETARVLPELIPAPWMDGEVLRLRISTAVGAEIGTIIYSAETTTREDKTLWQLDSRMVITVADMEQFTRVLAKRDSFEPVFGWTKNSKMGDFRAEYDGRHVRHITKVEGKDDKVRAFDLDHVAYDNEQAIYVIRRMPLKEGYEGSFPIFPVQSGVTSAAVEIGVVGSETVEVPAGRFECFKLDLAVTFGGERVLLHHVWISADKHRYLVKYDSLNALMELTEVTTLQKVHAGPTPVGDTEATIELPPGWFAYLHAHPSPQEMKLQLISPEMKVWALLAINARELGVDLARKAAEAKVEILKGFLEDYTVRPASWLEWKIAGLPAVRYVAEYDDQGKAMVEHRTCIFGKSKVYWFILRIEKDRFDSNRETFEAIVKSLRVREGEGTRPTSP